MRYFIFLLGAVLLGQQKPAPPEVDAALRDRVGKFFQDHVDGKFRQADTYVAEDSKDAFFERDKSRYRKIEDVTIDYNDDFTKAVVNTKVEMEWKNARMGSMIVHPTIKSNWKLENGQWYWYILRLKDVPTPFGTAHTDKLPPVNSNPEFKKVNILDVMGAVTVDRQDIQLSSYEKSADEVTISNAMPGTVSLSVESVVMPGLEVKLSEKELKSGEKSKLAFRYTPPDPTPKPRGMVYVTIIQTGRVIPLRITFAVPANAIPDQYKKQMPVAPK